MANTTITVGRVRGLRDAGGIQETWADDLRKSAGLPEVAEVELADGSYALDKSDPRFPVWEEFLAWQRDSGLYVYVEADVDTRVVREVFSSLPRRVRSMGVVPVEGRLRVTLHTSPAVYYLNSAFPRFVELKARLESAWRTGEEVLVTTHPLTFEFIDVRDAPGGADGLPNGTAVLDMLEEANFDRVPSEITLERAREVFEFLAASDIPFSYIWDCCTARAQKMCRLMREELNISSRKIWNYGRSFSADIATLYVETPADPSGRVYWVYHVAPTVKVVDTSVDTLVLDPAIFDEPVSIRTWVRAQHDKRSMQQPSAAFVYGNNPFGPDEFDPGPAEVDGTLNHHIGQGKLRKLFRPLFLPSPG